MGPRMGSELASILESAAGGNGLRIVADLDASQFFIMGHAGLAFHF